MITNYKSQITFNECQITNRESRARVGEGLFWIKWHMIEMVSANSCTYRK